MSESFEKSKDPIVKPRKLDSTILALLIFFIAIMGPKMLELAKQFVGEFDIGSLNINSAKEFVDKFDLIK